MKSCTCIFKRDRVKLKRDTINQNRDGEFLKMPRPQRRVYEAYIIDGN